MGDATIGRALGTSRQRRVVIALAAAVLAVAGLLVPPPAPASGDSAVPGYRFSMAWSKAKPVRWDPCTIVTWRINYAAGRAFAKELPLVKAAFAELGRTTGITFRYLGTSARAPFTRSASREPASILVGFAKPGRSGLPRRSSVIGYGGAGTGQPEFSFDAYYYRMPYTNGQAVWLSTAVQRMSKGQKRALYLHELGHVMGLAHSSKRSTIMYPSLTSATPSSFASGDKKGLALLGRRQGCVRIPSRPAAPTVVVSGENLVISVPAVTSPQTVAYRLETREGYASSTGSARSWTVPIAVADASGFGQASFRVVAINYFGQHTGPDTDWTAEPLP